LISEEEKRKYLQRDNELEKNIEKIEFSIAKTNALIDAFKTFKRIVIKKDLIKKVKD